MVQTQNDLIGYWAFASQTQLNSQIYIRFTESGLLQWGYQNPWLICNISHNYWIENGNIGTICLPNPRKELIPYSITNEGNLKLIYINRETVWKKAEKQEFFERKDIWNPGIPFPRQIDYMALLDLPPHPLQIKRAEYLGISPQILVNTNALWKLWEYSQAEFSSFHMDDFKHILDQSVLIDDEDDMDTTLLGYLAQDGYAEAVAVLIDKGADINHLDILENTPLDYAIWKNQTETIKLLRKHGAKSRKEIC